MKRTLLIVLAVVMLFSVSVFAFGTPSTQETEGTGETAAAGSGQLSDYKNAVVSEQALPDGTKVLLVLVQLEDGATATAAADKPAIFAALEVAESPYPLANYAFVYYDEVAKGGKKLASKTFEVATATWTTLTVPGAAAGGEGTATTSTGETYTIGDFQVTIKGIQIDKTYDEKDVVTVVYDFTNNSSETKSPSLSVQFKAFQDGVELDSGYASNDTRGSYKDIKAGATIKDVMASFVPTGTGPVTVEMKEWFSFDDATTVEVTLDYPQG